MNQYAEMDWNQLMPLIEEIERNLTVEIKGKSVIIGYANVFVIEQSKIEAVRRALGEFDQWKERKGQHYDDSRTKP